MRYLNISTTDKIQAIQKLNEMLEYSREHNKRKQDDKKSFKEILHKIQSE